MEEWKDCWKKPTKIQYREIKEVETIKTREGELKAYPEQDYLLKGIEGEVYPCKKDIFEKTYTTTPPKIKAQILKDFLSDEKVIEIIADFIDDEFIDYADETEACVPEDENLNEEEVENRFNSVKQKYALELIERLELAKCKEKESEQK